MTYNVHERLSVLFCDHLAIARGKYVTLKPGQSGGARFCRGTFGVTFEKELIPAPGAMVMEGLPDMEAAYTAKDIRLGWQPIAHVWSQCFEASSGRLAKHGLRAHGGHRA
jgi:glutamine synthetase